MQHIKAYPYEASLAALLAWRPGITREEVKALLYGVLPYPSVKTRQRVTRELITCFGLAEATNPLAEFVHRALSDKARKEAFLYHLLRHNSTLLAIATAIAEHNTEPILRLDLMRVLNGQMGKVSAETTLDHGLAVLREYGVISLGNPLVALWRDPEEESLSYILHMIFVAQNIVGPSLEEVANHPILRAEFFRPEGILANLHRGEGKWCVIEERPPLQRVLLAGSLLPNVAG